MPRGGSRVGAGRKADPNSKRQQALAKKKAGAKAPAKSKAGATGKSRAKAEKPAGAGAAAGPGASWPFPNAEQPLTPPATGAAEPDPDVDDGLTDEQRAGMSPLDYLLAVMRSSKASKSARMTAAIQAAPYVHAKLAPAGKKEKKKEEAGKVAGRFSAAAPPRLAAAGGKRV